MYANFLIGLREGLEAALVISILLAYLTRLGRPELRASVWAGTAAAIVLSVGAGALLEVTSTELPDRYEILFSGTMSAVAVGLVTWMIFWMARRARFLRTHLEGEVDRAVSGGGMTLAAISFVAVIREGLETALFLWSGATSTGNGEVTTPLVGAVAGLIAAALLGVALYRGAITVNLARLFQWSGVLLVVVAAGVLSYAIAEFAELGWIPGGESVAFDVSAIITPGSTVAEVLRGFFNFRPVTTWPVMLAWFAYIVPVMTMFTRRTQPVRA